MSCTGSRPPGDSPCWSPASVSAPATAHGGGHDAGARSRAPRPARSTARDGDRDDCRADEDRRHHDDEGVGPGRAGTASAPGAARRRWRPVPAAAHRGRCGARRRSMIRRGEQHGERRQDRQDVARLLRRSRPWKNASGRNAHASMRHRARRHAGARRFAQFTIRGIAASASGRPRQHAAHRDRQVEPASAAGR